MSLPDKPKTETPVREGLAALIAALEDLEKAGVNVEISTNYPRILCAPSVFSVDPIKGADTEAVVPECPNIPRPAAEDAAPTTPAESPDRRSVNLLRTAVAGLVGVRNPDDLGELRARLNTLERIYDIVGTSHPKLEDRAFWMRAGVIALVATGSP